jgi:phage terminase small subunit
MAGTHRSGRKRKPTAIKVLEGSYRKDRHGHEMQVLTGWPEPPVWMNDRERGIWDGLRPYCQAWITESDWPALYGLVSTMEMILLNREARAANEGEAGKPLAYTVKVDGDGSPIMEPKENPLFTQHMKLTNALRGFIATLGLSPVDRAKVHGNQPNDEAEDKWAGVLQ